MYISPQLCRNVLRNIMLVLCYYRELSKAELDFIVLEAQSRKCLVYLVQELLHLLFLEYSLGFSVSKIANFCTVEMAATILKSRLSFCGLNASSSRHNMARQTIAHYNQVICKLLKEKNNKVHFQTFVTRGLISSNKHKISETMGTRFLSVAPGGISRYEIVISKIFRCNFSSHFICGNIRSRKRDVPFY